MKINPVKLLEDPVGVNNRKRGLEGQFFAGDLLK